jgi:GNAT superfamily N-acetyltransferase
MRHDRRHGALLAEAEALCEAPRMTPPLTARALAHREEHRQGRAMADIADAALAIGGGYASFGGKGSWLNRASGVGLARPVSDADLDRLVDFFAARDVEPRIGVCSYTDASVITGLARRGFVMVNLHHVWSRVVPLSPSMEAGASSHQLVRVDPRDDVQVAMFADVTVRGFDDDRAPPAAITIEGTRRLARHVRTHAFLAFIDGAAVGGGAVEIEGGVASLFGTSILPPFRKRGLHHALLVHRLAYAQAKGCTVATLQGLPGSATDRNAARLGFTLAYARATLERTAGSVPTSREPSLPPIRGTT